VSTAYHPPVADYHGSDRYFSSPRGFFRLFEGHPHKPFLFSVDHIY
jgi:hypothetical protein